MNKKIIQIKDMNFREEIGDPFITRTYHNDIYPRGNKDMEIPLSNLKDKNLGDDFDPNSDWRLYHGRNKPGFPIHPHRGFETITIVLRGFLDHYDSSGSKGRYGPGDVQWLTAGRGLQHSEIFPLLNEDGDNPLEVFQIWLNLPSKDKFVDPFYNMLWAEDIPLVIKEDEKGNKSKVTIITGSYQNKKALNPNPNSWANNEKNNMRILIIELDPNTEFTIPKVSKTLNRNLQYYEGESIIIDNTNIKSKSSIRLAGNEDIRIINGNKKSSLLLLEGEPINEPMVSQGPFVMNTMCEIKNAHMDYNKTQFGGWPWDSREPVNPKDVGRFVEYSNGKIEKP